MQRIILCTFYAENNIVYINSVPTESFTSIFLMVNIIIKLIYIHKLHLEIQVCCCRSCNSFCEKLTCLR